MAEIKSCYNPLLGEMARRRMRKKDLAAELGLSEVSLYHRLRGTRPFTQDDISKIKHIFSLSPSEVNDIFFAD